MTRDFIEDFTEALKKEGKFFVIAIFNDDMLNVNVVNNLGSMPNQTFNYPGGHSESVNTAISRAIKFSLTGEN